jgi:hypothetical protein
MRAAKEVARQTIAVGASEVRIVDPPADVCDGWDLADAESEGWAEQRVLEWIADHQRAYLPSDSPDPADKHQSARQSRSNSDAAANHSMPFNLPTIRIIPGELPRVVDKAERAIRAAAAPFFRYGNMIVEPTVSATAAADGEPIFRLRLAPVTRHRLAEIMTGAAHFVRYDGRARDFVPVDAPLRIADTYLARDGKWKLRIVTGTIAAPTVRPNGSILDSTGYDSQTKLLFEPLGEKFPAIPRNPSKDDALKALKLLKEPFTTFPFVDGTDRSVALSAILSAQVRRWLPTAPLHAFSAPVAGSGKSMLVDIISIIATGRRAPVIAQGKSEEELEKRLGAILLANDAIVSIDNCEHPLGGVFLCQILTQQGAIKIRVLGESRIVEVPCNVALFATGNNLQLVGDMARRALLASLDPLDERPELLEFSTDPIAMVRKHRGTYVSAVLTILLAHFLAGLPMPAKPLGSYEIWSERVRCPLLWLGEPDPCDTMEKARDSDRKLAAFRTILDQWEAVLGEDRFLARQAADKASEREGSDNQSFRYPDFREALMAVAGDRGTVNTQRLGNWLQANKGRIIQGRRIVPDGGRSGALYWRLELVERP